MANSVAKPIRPNCQPMTGSIPAVRLPGGIDETPGLDSVEHVMRHPRQQLDPIDPGGGGGRQDAQLEK